MRRATIPLPMLMAKQNQCAECEDYQRQSSHCCQYMSYFGHVYTMWQVMPQQWSIWEIRACLSQEPGGPYFRNTLLRGHCLTEHPHLLFLFSSLFVHGTWWVRKFQKAKSSFTIGGTFHCMKCSSYEQLSIGLPIVTGYHQFRIYSGCDSEKALIL